MLLWKFCQWDHKTKLYYKITSEHKQYHYYGMLLNCFLLLYSKGKITNNCVLKWN